MQEVLKIMDKEHSEIENLYKKFLSLINTGDKKAIDIFIRFRTLLIKHFQWEEKILFPLFEENTGLTGEDISFVLRNEHAQIKKIFLNKIDEKIAQGKFNEIKKFMVGLEEMLKMHRNLETELFYPWFDDTLDKVRRERIITELKNSGKQ